MGWGRGWIGKSSAGVASSGPWGRAFRIPSRREECLADLASLRARSKIRHKAARKASLFIPFFSLGAPLGLDGGGGFRSGKEHRSVFSDRSWQVRRSCRRGVAGPLRDARLAARKYPLYGVSSACGLGGRRRRCSFRKAMSLSPSSRVGVLRRAIQSETSCGETLSMRAISARRPRFWSHQALSSASKRSDAFSGIGGSMPSA